MFFCHAIEVQRNELLKRGEDVSRFPIVKCFERSPGPGGVWRSDRSHEDGHDEHVDDMNVDAPFFCEEKKEEDEQSDFHKVKKAKLNKESSKQGNESANMYSALWTNGAKESFEFSDYTFKDHFGDVSMPTYLPRKYVLDYIMARCTTSCPNFFEKYFSFRTTVVNVSYQERTENAKISEHSINNKFRVHTRNETTGVEEIKIYDKCIWASGINGIPYIPKKMHDLFQEGGFKGSLVHSSDTNNFKNDVENKRVLIVGGGLSAEDLALMAIKEGASRIYCTHRGSHEHAINWTTRWPYDKVEVLSETTVVKVEGNTVTLNECIKNYYEGTNKLDKEGKETVLTDIDTVIFCTGYSPNLSMLDPILRDAADDGEDNAEGVKMPKGWKMNEDKAMEKAFGEDFMHIKPSKYVYANDDFSTYFEDLYQGCFLIKNPNMMYFLNCFTNTLLMETDITAWSLAKYVTGQRPLPSSQEMEEHNIQITLHCMQNIFLRYKMDKKFNRAVDKLGDFNEEQDEVWNAKEEEAERFQFHLLGRIMNDSEYPIRFVCKDGETISELGEKSIFLVKNDVREIMDKIKYDVNEDSILPDADNGKKNWIRPGWMTFRDAPKDGEFASLFTGIVSKSLPKPWFELDENDTLW